ncbi:MAG: DNA primase [Armatimonadota bacterium]
MVSSRYPLEDIRSRCDIVEIISPYVALKRSGKNLKGACPFHSEKTPSFVVNRDTQRWMCFGCGANGDVFSFLMRIEGLTFPEAVEQLAAKVGVEITHSPKDMRSAGERDIVFHVNNLATAYFRKTLERNKEARDYIQKRGISPEAVEQFKLGFALSEWSGLADCLRTQRVKLADGAKAGLLIARESGQGYYDRFRNRLIFPIFDIQNRVIGFGGRDLGGSDAKYINSPETPVFVKNRTLYALNFARKSIIDQGCVILVEGYMDALTAHTAGFTNVVATLGTALTSEHVNVLSRYTKTAVLAYDSDSAGMSAAMRSAPMFEEAEFEVKAAPLPAGEDPDSLIRRGDRAVFAELVEGAIPVPDYRLRIIAAKHDTGTRAGQLALLKEAIPVVAEVTRQVERERLIALLAPYHPNFRSGTVPAEVHIRQEVEARRARIATKSSSSEKKKMPPRVNLISEEGKAVRKAERELLGNILCHGLDALDIFVQIPPDKFLSDDVKAVAAAMQEELTRSGTLNIDSLAAKLAATPGEQLLNELLVTASEVSGTPTEDLISTIKIYHKKELEKRFRTLAEKFERGEIKRTDNEFAEYWQLVQELHN